MRPFGGKERAGLAPLWPWGQTSAGAQKRGRTGDCVAVVAAAGRVLSQRSAAAKAKNAVVELNAGSGGVNAAVAGERVAAEGG